MFLPIMLILHPYSSSLDVLKLVRWSARKHEHVVNSPAPLPAEICQMPRRDQTAPSSSSIAYVWTCLMSALSCETSSQSMTSIPIHRLILSSAEIEIRHDKGCPNLHLYCRFCARLFKSICTKHKPKLRPKNKKSYKWRHLWSGRVRYLLTWSDQSFPAMDVIHLLCGNPRAGLIIGRKGDAILPTLCRHKKI